MAKHSQGDNAPPELSNSGLVYVRDSEPGITRVRRGTGFSYHYDDGGKVESQEVLSRIRSLVIPPAWEDVWICKNPEGHLQATGRDARGRKQYRYHPEWSRSRNTDKFRGLRQFGESLADIRGKVQSDLLKRSHTKQKVVAIAIALLDECYIRVGNEEYASTNNTYGLTTLKDRHVRIERDHIHFHFRGKGGKEHDIDVKDPRLARLVKQCRDIPGQSLFQFKTEDGGHEAVRSQDINHYLERISDRPFTAKMFRTWAGTVHAVAYLWDAELPKTKRARKKNTVEAVKFVSSVLGNTPATCRKYYIHPVAIDSYLEGEFCDAIKRHRSRKAWQELDAAEKSVLKLLVHYEE